MTGPTFQPLKHTDNLPRPFSAAAGRVTASLAAGLGVLHGGAVGDYVAWLAVGLALFAITFALA